MATGSRSSANTMGGRIERGGYVPTSSGNKNNPPKGSAAVNTDAGSKGTGNSGSQQPQTGSGK